MRSALAALIAAATVAAAAVGVGCVLITGSTDGYRLQGSGDGGVDGGAAPLACVSAAQCDGGSVCCLVINSSMTFATTSCQTSCGGTYPVQMCKSPAECGNNGICTTQSCSFGSLTVAIQACGTVAGLCMPQ